MPPEPCFWTKDAVETVTTEACVDKKSGEPWKVSSPAMVLCSISVGELLRPRPLMFCDNLSLAASSPKALWLSLKLGSRQSWLEEAKHLWKGCLEHSTDMFQAI